VFFILLWLILSVFLQSVYRFHFYHIEQYRLFLFDGDYLFSALQKTGGLSLLIGEFLTQFFIYPYAGALITSVLPAGAGVLLRIIFRRMDGGLTGGYLRSLLPVFSLLFIQLDFNYFIQGTVAYLMALLCLCVYGKIGNVRGRAAYAVLSAFLLFWWGGSVAVLFVISVFAGEWLSAPSRCRLFLVPCAEVLLLAFLSVRYAFVGEYRFALLPDMYYQEALKPPGILLYMPWILLPLSMAAGRLLRSVKTRGGKKRYAGILLRTVLAGSAFFYGLEAYGDRRSLKFKEMEYHCRNRRFDRIIEMNRGEISNYLYLCFLNLALAEKGELAGRMFTFDQKGPQSLFIPMNNSHVSSMLLCDIYYAIGHTGAAMQMAFEANVGSPGHRTGRMLQRLVETNLICGEYAVAEKYIALLEKSLYYRNWAKGMRRYLGDDEAVSRNPELGKRRRSLPAANFLFSAQPRDRDLISLSVSNPDNRTAIEYAGAMYLLMKQSTLFGELIDKYLGTEALPGLPLSFQEAVIVLNENDPASWREKGVSRPVIARFEQYKRFILENRNKPRVADYVKKSFGDTYWYYFMFKQ
jgi:hypothetical protein